MAARLKSRKRPGAKAGKLKKPTGKLEREPAQTEKKKPSQELLKRHQKVLSQAPGILEMLKVYDSFAKAQDSLTCWASIVDTQAKVISWNKTAEKISGYSREEVLGHSGIWERLYPDPEYRAYIFSEGMEIIKEGIINRETMIVAKDGKKKNISWHSNYLVDESGKVKGVVALGADVTEQREIEEQVQLKQKMDGLARLAGNIAHDFNNIFSIIQGYVELSLERMDYSDPGREDLLEIVDAVERGSGLTNQLLAFSKHQMMEPIALDLNKIVREMNQLIKRTLGEKIELTQNLAPELPTIQADPSQIQQVILNLAMNAREAMPEAGKFTVSTSLAKIGYPQIRARPFVSPGEYILLAISDTGPGVSPELKEKIFEPFLSTKAGKVGLGLSSVYGIISQHNGYIWVESEPGKGTAFKIFLPTSGKPAEIPRPKKTALDLPKGSEVILLVEDDDHMRALAVRILRNLGYTVIESNHPKEALQILEQYPEPVQLLLTDVEMPEMNGAELADQALKIRTGLKVLYFSGYSLAYLLDKKILKPDSPLLAKPFSMRSISQKVREILNKKK